LGLYTGHFATKGQLIFASAEEIIAFPSKLPHSPSVHNRRVEIDCFEKNNERWIVCGMRASCTDAQVMFSRIDDPIPFASQSSTNRHFTCTLGVSATGAQFFFPSSLERGSNLWNKALLKTGTQAL